uniref:Transmembrane protein n=1 Tax=Corethron hystrix TaxID=216773 RepID=A0A7S1BEH2_9STRA|mmetsp:Transcript_24188/g.55008  ORF Transcript_24188/g.55008 Transcript_24188/m.55008 type:complete len:182 (+) Transcript_24188:204-749(+)
MTQLPRQCRRIVLVVAAVGLVSIRAASSGGFATAAHFSKCAVSEGCRATSISYHRKSQSFLPLIVRGGASEVDEEDEYDEDTEDESEEEVDSEESEEEEEDTVLFASLTKASTKQKAKDKAKLSAVLKSIPKKKKRRRGGSVAFMKIPYLIRIMFQPLTLFAMTRGYWRSLFDPFYPEIVS